MWVIPEQNSTGLSVRVEIGGRKYGEKWTVSRDASLKGLESWECQPCDQLRGMI